jgi:tRNA A37 threonylcarbamoyladenosine synthetase subunit TsaC/SUA5/YrdC
MAGMREIWYEGESHLEDVFSALSNNAVLVDLGSVFAVVSLPTTQGVSQMNSIKRRLPNKYYGSIVGDVKKFIQHSKGSDELKNKLITAALKGEFNNTFIRLPWPEESFSTEIVNLGTHQGLILSEPFKSFALELEGEITKREGKHGSSSKFNWLLGSSANLSGDPNGSITSLQDALSFGEQRGIKLLIRFEIDSGNYEKGSFPIIECTEKSYTVRREGPGINRIRENMEKLGLSQFIERTS